MLPSLNVLRVEQLRQRTYGGKFGAAYPVGDNAQQSFLAEYDADGLRLLTRVDLPSGPQPAAGFPVLVFLHGWVGIDAAPGFDFYPDPNSDYGRLIEHYRRAGFVVLTPGFRGHGNAGGRPADGVDYMAAWDNGTYLSPVFYAIDVLNMLDSLESLPGALPADDQRSLDLDRIYLASHSQGGDVALIATAVSGEGSMLRNTIRATSIMAGTFPERLTQLETYYPMQATQQAFVSGDGSWTATARGMDGTVNRDFVFGFPSDWIGTPHADQWTWQHEVWALPDVAAAWSVKLEQLYTALNERVENIEDARFSIRRNADGLLEIVHDQRVLAGITQIGAFHLPEYLSEPLMLHYSDRDFYSLAEWNTNLCSRVNAAGGNCKAYEYAGTDHRLRSSEHAWLSPAGTRDGFDVALAKDAELFLRDAAD